MGTQEAEDINRSSERRIERSASASDVMSDRRPRVMQAKKVIRVLKQFLGRPMFALAPTENNP